MGITMTEQRIMEFRNQARRLVEVANRGRSNSINIGANESLTHARKKFEICWDLVQQNKEFYTECKFTSGGRADIFILDDSKVIEIACSETEESLMEKAKKYPFGIDIEVVKVV